MLQRPVRDKVPWADLVPMYEPPSETRQNRPKIMPSGGSIPGEIALNARPRSPWRGARWHLPSRADYQWPPPWLMLW